MKAWRVLALPYLSPTGGYALGSYPQYEQAQAVVDQPDRIRASRGTSGTEAAG